MKEKIKSVAMVFGIFASALLLYGIFTCGWFSWWMIPVGIVSAVYLIGIIVVGYINTRRGIW